MTAAAAARSSGLGPSLAVAGSGAMWGLFWAPLNYFSAQGVNGAWVVLIFFLVTLVTIAPLLVLRWRDLRDGAAPAVGVGLLTGGSFALYTLSLVLTDVVHALLLFYVSPVWSTIIGWFVHGERITLTRLLAIALGLAGLGVVLGADQGLPLPRNIGDWLAFAGGVVWSVGSIYLTTERTRPLLQPVGAFILGGTAIAVAILMLPIPGFGSPPDADTLGRTLPGIVGLALVLFVPTSFLVTWGVRNMSAGRSGILLMTEVVVGTASAALFSGQPFGIRELLGASLIVSAGFVEVLGRSDPVAPARDNVGAG